MQPISLKAARYEFTATRDENGVPHVEAPDWREALGRFKDEVDRAGSF